MAKDAFALIAEAIEKEKQKHETARQELAAAQRKVSHHAAVMAKLAAVSEAIDSGPPIPTNGLEDLDAKPKTRSGTVRRSAGEIKQMLLNYIGVKPLRWWTSPELEQATGVSQSQVYYNLQLMTKAGEIVVDRSEAKLRYKIAE